MRYETNAEAGVIASILVSNTGPDSLRVLIVSQAKPDGGWKRWAVPPARPYTRHDRPARDTLKLKTTPDPFVAQPSSVITNRVLVPERKPWLVVAVIYNDYSGLFDRARLWLDRKLRSARYVRKPGAGSVEFCILEISE